MNYEEDREEDGGGKRREEKRRGEDTEAGKLEKRHRTEMPGWRAAVTRIGLLLLLLLMMLFCAESKPGSRLGRTSPAK